MNSPMFEATALRNVAKEVKDLHDKHYEMTYYQQKAMLSEYGGARSHYIESRNETREQLLNDMDEAIAELTRIRESVSDYWNN